MKILFSFDTEDFIDPQSDDTLLDLCKTFSRHDLRACICLVTERARVLRERRRWDVLEALKSHEVNSHTAFHSVHPTCAEYTEPLDWREGVRENLLREGEALDLLKEICGVDTIRSAIKPGYSWSPQGIYAYRLLGVSCFGDGPFMTPLPGGRPVYYCGCLNTSYRYSIEGPIREGKVDQFLDEILDSGDELVVVYAHPTMLDHSEFWDAVNFKQGQNRPWGDWIIPKRRTPEVYRKTMRNLDRLLSRVKGKKSIEVITYEELADSVVDVPRELNGGQAVDLAKAAVKKKDETRLDRAYLSPAEVFGVLNWAMANDATVDERLVPVRFLLGPTEPPPAHDWRTPVGAELRIEDLRKTAQRLETGLRYNVPSIIKARDGLQLPPMAYLDVLARALAGKGKQDPIEVRDAPMYPETYERYGLDEISFKGAWSIIFPEGFDAPNIVRHARAQSWSIKRAPLS